MKMKERIYQSCVKSVMYERETWRLTEDKMVTMRRTERAITRAICGIKLIDKRNSKKGINILGIEETLDKLLKAGVLKLGSVEKI